MATYWVLKDEDGYYFMGASPGRMRFVGNRARAKKYTTRRKAFAGARLCRRTWGGEIHVARVGPDVPWDVVLTGEAAGLVREWRQSDAHAREQYIDAVRDAIRKTDASFVVKLLTAIGTEVSP